MRFAFLCLSLCFTPSWVLAGDPPWEDAFFEAPAEEIIAFSQETESPADAAVDYHLVSSFYEYDAEGKLTATHRYVYTVLNDAGVENYASTSASWAPWFQNKPEIRVRITNPDGSVYELDPETLTEQASEQNGNVYSDRKVLAGPLPRVMVGSVIEEEIRITDHTPFFEQGSGDMFYFYFQTPVRKTQLTISYPKNNPFHLETLEMDGAEITYKKKKKDGRRIHSFEQNDYQPPETWESFIPYNVIGIPRVAFSPAEDWQSLAKAYGKIVDEKLATADFSWVPKEAFEGLSVREKVAKASMMLNEKVRYTGMELGENAIIPVAPATLLERGYGDCKDQAVFLTGMLRSLGLDAHVALLKAGTGSDIVPEIPSISMFNHAITYVDGEEPIWTDPTYDLTRNAYLPISDQDRWALIASDRKDPLVKTWKSISPENFTRETRRVGFPEEEGKGWVRETTVFQGSDEIQYRYDYLGESNEDIEERMERYVIDVYGEGELESFTYSDPVDLSKPFEIQLHITDVADITIDSQNAMFVFSWGNVIGNIPSMFWTDLKNEELEDRKHDVYWPQPHVYEVRYEVEVPKPYVLRELPKNKVYRFGTAKLEFEYDNSNPELFVSAARFDLGDRTISKEAYKSFIEEAQAIRQLSTQIKVYFDHQGIKNLKDKNYKEAVTIYRDLFRENPENLQHALAYRGILEKVGLIEEAQRIARETAAKFPESAKAHHELGLCLQKDQLGRTRTPGYPREEVLAAFSRAYELEPDNTLYKLEKAIELQHNQYGMLNMDQEQIKESARLMASIEEEHIIKNILSNRILAAMITGDPEIMDGVLEDIKDQKDKQKTEILFTFLTKGKDAGLKDLENIEGKTARNTAAAEILQDLLQMGRFEAAAAILRYVSKDAPNASQQEFMAARIEEAGKLSLEKDPGTHIKNFVLWYATSAMFNPEAIKEKSSPFLWEAYKKNTTTNDIYQIVKLMSGGQLLNMKEMIKLGFAISEIQVTGNKQTDFRAKLIPAQQEHLSDVFYIRHNGNDLQVVANEKLLGTFGQQIMEALEEKNLERARFYRKQLQDRFGGLRRDSSRQVSEIGDIWPNNDEEDPGSYKAWAAIAYFISDMSEEAYQIFGELAADETVETRRNFYLKYQMLSAMKTNQHNDSLDIETLTQMRKNHLEDYELLNMEFAYWVRQGNVEKARALLDESLTLPHLETEEKMLFAQRYGQVGDIEKARSIFKEINEMGLHTPASYNNYAWLELFAEDMDNDVLDTIHRATNNTSTYSSAHTLATILAVMDRPQEAWEALKKAVINTGRRELESLDFLVMGLIAERYGLQEHAVSLYNRVEKPEFEELVWSSSWRLAQLRMEAMNKAAGTN